MINDKFKIKKENLIRLLDILKDKANLLAPHKDEYGDIYFLKVSDVSKVLLQHFKPLMPAIREGLFKQMQDMINYTKEGKKTRIETTGIEEKQETILFGLPTCDLEGIFYNDVFYAKREFSDFYYTSIRNELTLINIVCTTPPNENCFCASMKHGPFSETGFDIQLTDINNNYFIAEIGSKKGEIIISSQINLFKQLSNEDTKSLEAIKTKAKILATKPYLNKEKALENMAYNPLNNEVLDDISKRCISCGACNYTCPTCECFNVVDINFDNKGVRKRILDTCILSGYWRMAGGHNPKPERTNRTRNRYYCKLLWDKEKFGDSGCVGCGRCLDSCPVNIDIKEVIKSLS